MSRIGTLIFFVVTGGKVPSYLGSSFAFIGVVIGCHGRAAKAPTPTGRSPGGIRPAACSIRAIRGHGQMAPAGSSAMPPWSPVRWWR